MAVSLDPDLVDALEVGDLLILPLVRIDLPELTVGYHFGGRDFEYPQGSGFIYRANKALSANDFEGSLGNAINERELTFSGIPDDNDPVAKIEEYKYLNAPVTITYLAGPAGANEPSHVLVTHFYKIVDVVPAKSARSADGTREVTIVVTIAPIADRYRNQTYIRQSLEDQQLHNKATDTFDEYANTVDQWKVEWGRV